MIWWIFNKFYGIGYQNIDLFNCKMYFLLFFFVFCVRFIDICVISSLIFCNNLKLLQLINHSVNLTHRYPLSPIITQKNKNIKIKKNNKTKRKSFQNSAISYISFNILTWFFSFIHYIFRRSEQNWFRTACIIWCCGVWCWFECICV